MQRSIHRLDSSDERDFVSDCGSVRNIVALDCQTSILDCSKLTLVVGWTIAMVVKEADDVHYAIPKQMSMTFPVLSRKCDCLIAD